jgi:2-polyprenyl-3-methyl-5-hydroxy-6-metoxy-1,4-benzoquinol methylase
VLDFGSGIGSGCLCLRKVGCNVDAADVAERLLEFVQFRFQQRQDSVSIINLNKDQPKENHYDMITAFDVLEHIPDQLAKLRKLEKYLRPGGYLLVNLMDNSYHPDRPMHVSSAVNWLKLIRKTSLTPDWSNYLTELQVLQRSRFGRWRNLLAGLRERS